LDELDELDVVDELDEVDALDDVDVDEDVDPDAPAPSLDEALDEALDDAPSVVDFPASVVDDVDVDLDPFESFT